MRCEAHYGVARETSVTVGVLVVDNSEPFRKLLRELVEAAPGLSCAGEADSGEAALEAVELVSPQMVVMDKRMPGLGGVAAAREIRARHPEVVVVLVSAERPETAVLEASGATAFLHKQQLSPQALADVWAANARPS
jgi:DNA-binding NarL/FixJ family response regulator